MQGVGRRVKAHRLLYHSTLGLRVIKKVRGLGVDAGDATRVAGVLLTVHGERLVY